MTYSLNDDNFSEWFLYKNQNGIYNNFYQSGGILYEGNYFHLTHTFADIDCDIYEELIVFAKPYIQTVEFFEYDMQNSWSISSNTKLLSTYDLNNNGRLNLIEYYYGGPDDFVLKIYEDTRPLIKQNITLPTTWNEDVVIIDEIEVDQNLTVSEGVNVFISYDGKLDVNPTGSFSLNNNTTVYGYLANNIINMDGSLTTGLNVKFTVEDHFIWSGIKFGNTANDYSFTDSYFRKCKLLGNSKSLLAQGCQFDSSGINYSKGNLIVDNSDLNMSNIHAFMGASKSSYIEIKNNSDIQGYDDNAAVIIDGYYI